MSTQIAIAVVEQDGRYLIGLRPAGVPLVGLWEFPGGKIEPGENAADAAVRECLEETQLHVRVLAEYPSTTHHYPHGALELRFFRCLLVDAAETPAERFRWVSASEFSRYEFPPANAALLALLSAESPPHGAT